MFMLFSNVLRLQLALDPLAMCLQPFASLLTALLAKRSHLQKIQTCSFF